MVFAAARHLMRQTQGIAEYRIFCRGPYRGPRFPSDSGRVRVVGRRRGPFGREAGLRERLCRCLAWTHLFETRQTWISNVEPGDEPLLRWLFDADQVRAIVVFTVIPDFALHLARLTHLFCSRSAPHIIVVTPEERVEVATVQDLHWLRTKVLWDGNAVASAASAPATHRQTPDQCGDKPARGLTPMAFDTSGPVSFLDVVSYPQQLGTDDAIVAWQDWIGPNLPLPDRVPDVVLFIRPDWTSCGSATTFASLAEYFRRNDALLIDIATWPYAVPFGQQERTAKIKEEQRHIRAALYFSLRRTNSLPYALRQLFRSCSFPPVTTANQRLLENALAATPPLVRAAVQRSAINVIYLNHYFTYLHSRDLIAGRPFFLDTHDIQATNVVDHGAINMFTRRTDSFQKLMEQEMRILRKADRLCFVSLAEMKLAAQYIPPDKLDFIIALPQIAACPPKKLGAPPRLLIVASNNKANERNLLWFLNQVAPQMLNWQADAAQVGHDSIPLLDIYGSIDIAMKDVRRTGLRFHGVVGDLRACYDRCDIVLLPVIVGGGVSIKTIEALLHEKPVVATRHALRGLPDEVIDAIGYANDPEEFAQTVVALLESDSLRREYTDRSRHGALLLRHQGFYERLTGALDAVRLPPAVAATYRQHRGRVSAALPRDDGDPMTLPAGGLSLRELELTPEVARKLVG